MKQSATLPLCAICCETLGKYGGPTTLPCGHNGCADCLCAIVQTQSRAGREALCPLCRAPFSAPLPQNTELRDLISLATSIMDEQERQDGWEAFPDRALTAEEYAADLKLGRSRSDQLMPSAPLAPALPGSAAVAKHQQVMQLPPPQWLPDSMAVSCGACHKPFRPLTRLRHHCRCCGRIFCHGCSSQRALLPPTFNSRVPERVCDTCAAMLGPLQPYLAGTQAAAAQPPVHDAVLDGVSLRSWLNLPYGNSLEQDIFKAANVLAKFTQASRLQPELGIPSAVLGGVCGLVLMSLFKVGMGWSATFGTGVIVSRNSAGQWSAPCAVAAAGLGWGLQIGGELTDLLLVLRTPEAVKACCGVLHVGVGGSAGVALGPLGRTADAHLLMSSAALTAPGAAYAYSCSQGAFLGVSLEGSLLTVRDSVNHSFYGVPVTARSLLVERSVAPPPAAAALYDALHALMRKYEVKTSYNPPITRISAPEPTLRLPAPASLMDDHNAPEEHATHQNATWPANAPSSHLQGFDYNSVAPPSPNAISANLHNNMAGSWHANIHGGVPVVAHEPAGEHGRAAWMPAGYTDRWSAQPAPQLTPSSIGSGRSRVANDEDETPEYFSALFD